MELRNSFTVGLPIDEAWKTFIDLERIAPCLPGAVLTDVIGEDYHGAVKIKVGPVKVQYTGVATFLEKDESAHRAVIDARGKDVGGQGNANAKITATLTPHGDGTEVIVETDLDLSGRVAQFGRGVVADVSNKLLNQFVANLEDDISRTVGSAPASEGKPQRMSIDDVEPLDVVGSMGGIVAKYALPVVGSAAALVCGLIVWSRERRASKPTWPESPRLGAPTGGPVNIFVSLALPSSGASALPDRGDML